MDVVLDDEELSFDTSSIIDCTVTKPNRNDPITINMVAAAINSLLLCISAHGT